MTGLNGTRLHARHHHHHHRSSLVNFTGGSLKWRESASRASSRLSILNERVLAPRKPKQRSLYLWEKLAKYNKFDLPPSYIAVILITGGLLRPLAFEDTGCVNTRCTRPTPCTENALVGGLPLFPFLVSPHQPIRSILSIKSTFGRARLFGNEPLSRFRGGGGGGGCAKTRPFQRTNDSISQRNSMDRE